MAAHRAALDVTPADRVSSRRSPGCSLHPPGACLIVLLLISALGARAIGQTVPREFSRGEQVVVTLPNGDVLQGVVRSDNGLELVLQHDLLGLLVLPLASIEITRDDPLTMPRDESVTWSGNLAMTADGSLGNTEDARFYTRADIVRRAQDTRDTFSVDYAREKESNDTGKRETSKDQLMLQWQRELITQGSPWLPTLIVSEEIDKQKNYDHRGSARAGLGYALIDTETERLVPRFGAGLSKKFGAEEEDDILYEGFAGVDYQLDMTSHSHFTITSYFIPAISESRQYRTLSRGELRYDLDDESRWYLLLAFDHEYDNTPDTGDDRNDFDYWAGLGLRF